MSRDELTADDVWRTLRHVGWRACTREAFVQFRYGDGFSHARALGLQLSLAAIPMVISLVGLSGTLHTRRIGMVLRETVLSLVPGASDDLLRVTLTRSLLASGQANTVALALGLVFALVSLTTAMGQLERGANRIYGLQRDRPSRSKYTRAAVLACSAGLPAMVGVLVLVGVTSFGEVVEDVYGLDDDFVSLLGVPAGVVLILGSVTVVLRRAPRRAQPSWSWLAIAAGLILTLWVTSTALLAGYLLLSSNFDAVYGPLTGVMALLLWAQAASAGTFYGFAFAAQLEAFRAGIPAAEPQEPQSPETRPGRA